MLVSFLLVVFFCSIQLDFNFNLSNCRTHCHFSFSTETILNSFNWVCSLPWTHRTLKTNLAGDNETSKSNFSSASETHSRRKTHKSIQRKTLIKLYAKVCLHMPNQCLFSVACYSTLRFFLFFKYCCWSCTFCKGSLERL